MEPEDVETVEDLLGDMLETSNSYSEALIIGPDGTFAAMRLDNVPIYAFYRYTPAELYEIALVLHHRHPDWHFSFETDPEGQWVKYTVLKK